MPPIALIWELTWGLIWEYLNNSNCLDFVVWIMISFEGNANCCSHRSEKELYTLEVYLNSCIPYVQISTNVLSFYPEKRGCRTKGTVSFNETCCYYWTNLLRSILRLIKVFSLSALTERAFQSSVPLMFRNLLLNSGWHLFMVTL